MYFDQVVQKSLKGFREDKMLELTVTVHQDRKRILQHKVTDRDGDGTNPKHDDVNHQLYKHVVLTFELPNANSYPSTGTYIYVVDLAGAQYGQHRAVMPFTEYRDTWTAAFHGSSSYGQTAAEFRFDLAMMTICRHSNDARVLVVHEMVRGELDRLVNLWEGNAGLTLAQVAEANRQPYGAKKVELVAMLLDGLVKFVSTAEKDGKFTFQKLQTKPYPIYLMPHAFDVEETKGQTSECDTMNLKPGVEETFGSMIERLQMGDTVKTLGDSKMKGKADKGDGSPADCAREVKGDVWSDGVKAVAGENAKAERTASGGPGAGLE